MLIIDPMIIDPPPLYDPSVLKSEGFFCGQLRAPSLLSP